MASQTRSSGFWDGVGIGDTVGVLLAWALALLMALVFATLPGVISQTRILVGEPLIVHRTPKRRPSAGSGLNKTSVPLNVTVAPHLSGPRLSNRAMSVDVLPVVLPAIGTILGLCAGT